MEKYIEHTLLKQDATEQDLINLFEEAKKYNFLGVCINPCYVKLAKECLKNLIRYRSDSNSQVASEGNSLYTEIMQDTAAAQAAESMKEKNERTKYTEEVLNPMQQDLAASDSIRNDISSVAQSSNQTQILLNGIIKTYTSQLTSEALENLGKYNAKYVDTTEEGQ